MAANKKKDKETNRKTSAGSVLTGQNNLLPAWITVILISIFTFIIFSPAFGAFFTNWDDLDYIINNPLVASNKLRLKEIFTTPVMGNYHPITMLTLAWNFQSSQFDPSVYHRENVVFHVLNTVLVFFFIFKLTRRNLLMAGIVALLFSIHPMHVESVAWVSERKDVLYVFFLLGGLITYFNYKESNKIAWYLFTLLLFILSCLSKGMAVVFPVILLLVDYVMGAKWDKKTILEKIPFFILAIGFGISVFIIQQNSKAIDILSFSIPQKIMFASYGCIMYIVKFIAPVKLSAVYSYPNLDKNGNVPAEFYFYPLLIIGIIALVYFFLRKEKAVVFGLLFYLVSVALVLQFISVGSVIMADRYSYLAYIGLSFIVAHLVNKVWETKSERLASLKYPVTGSLALVLIIFSYQTYARTQVWHDCDTLWTDVMEKYPNTFLAYKNRGYYYQSINEDDKALADYNKVLQLNPRYEEAYNNRANIYNKRGQYDLALADYNMAISIDTSYSVLFMNRAICYDKTGRYDKAIADFTRAIKLNPADANSYNARGGTLLKINRVSDAIADFAKAAQLNPAVSDYQLNLSRAQDALKFQAKQDSIKAQ